MRVQYVVVNPGHQVGSYVREGDLGRELTNEGHYVLEFGVRYHAGKFILCLSELCQSRESVPVPILMYRPPRTTSKSLRPRFVTDLEISKST